MDIFLSLIVAGFAFALLGFMFDNTVPALLIALIAGVAVFFSVRNYDKKTEESFKQGQTITTLVKRVDWKNSEVYILTEDSSVFTENDSKYKILTPGDTLIYQRSTEGEKRIIDIKYSDNKHISKNDEKEEEEEQEGLTYMMNPGYLYDESQPLFIYF